MVGEIDGCCERGKLSGGVDGDRLTGASLEGKLLLGHAEGEAEYDWKVGATVSEVKR